MFTFSGRAVRVCAIGFLVLAATTLHAAALTLVWDPNPEPDIAGYTVLYGTHSGQYTVQVNVGKRTDFTLPSLPNGSYYFVVQAYNQAGLRSPLSAEIRADIGLVGTGDCATPDPFIAMGGGTCYNGGWLAPGMTIPSDSTSSSAPAPSSQPAPSQYSGTCATPDPFVAMGGGTCYNGGWLPPGMTIPSGGTSSPAPTPSPAPAPTQYSGTCATPDPFVAMGGGTCYNGGWLAPGMSIPGGGTSSPPQYSGGCTTPDPYVALGGGTCSNGSWFPPATATGTCITPDPFIGIPGLVGICSNGGWVPVQGVSTTGTIRFYSLSGGFWGIAGDDGVTYVPLDGLDPQLQTNWLRVSFKGALRTDVVTQYGGTVIQILAIVAQ